MLLWTGDFGADPHKIMSRNDQHLYAYLREKDGDKVVVILNFSDKNQNFSLKGTGYEGAYKNVFSTEKMNLVKEAKMVIKAWGYLVLSNK